MDIFIACTKVYNTIYVQYKLYCAFKTAEYEHFWSLVISAKYVLRAERLFLAELTKKVKNRSLLLFILIVIYWVCVSTKKNDRWSGNKNCKGDHWKLTKDVSKNVHGNNSHSIYVKTFFPIWETGFSLTKWYQPKIIF